MYAVFVVVFLSSRTTDPSLFTTRRRGHKGALALLSLLRIQAQILGQERRMESPAEKGEYDGYSADVKYAEPLGLAPSSRSTLALPDGLVAAAAK